MRRTAAGGSGPGGQHHVEAVAHLGGWWCRPAAALRIQSGLGADAPGEGRRPRPGCPVLPRAGSGAVTAANAWGTSRPWLPAPPWSAQPALTTPQGRRGRRRRSHSAHWLLQLRLRPITDPPRRTQAHVVCPLPSWPYPPPHPTPRLPPDCVSGAETCEVPLGTTTSLCPESRASLSPA